ncbi:MAG: hypothetical protein KGD74_04645, partial [Candidatus Lokiarchaeota archaeon]|nr:hypothetical protein [Candidatus Lokiarchaeota archaeon]
MAKDKKKKKKKGSSKDEYGTFSQMMGQDSDKKLKSKARSAGGLPYGVSLGNPVDRSTDKLFLGTDYREVLIPERSWAEILADIEHWTPLPFTHGIEMELIIADDDG